MDDYQQLKTIQANKIRYQVSHITGTTYYDIWKGKTLLGTKTGIGMDPHKSALLGLLNEKGAN